MTKPLYTAHAHVTGGRAGRGRTDDGALDLDLRPPKEMGGDGTGTNPEQLFAVGYASCFGSALGLVAQRAGVATDDLAIDSSVRLEAIGGGRFQLGVELRVSLPSVPTEQAAELVRTAHQVCPYSNATRGNIEVALEVNGQAV